MAFWKQKIIFSICFISLLSFAAPLTVEARGLVPCGGYEENGSREKPCNVSDLFVLIARVTNFLIGFAGVFAVYEIISAGFWMVASAGNEEAITSQKGKATNAIIGLVLVLMAYTFINTAVNFLLTRGLVASNPDGTTKAECALDLSNPWTYLTIDPNKCSNVNDADLHK